MHTSMFAHRSSHNETALFLVSLVALLVNIAVAVYHVYRIAKFRRNPFTQEVYPDTPDNTAIIATNASDEDKELIAARAGRTPAELGYDLPWDDAARHAKTRNLQPPSLQGAPPSTPS